MVYFDLRNESELTFGSDLISDPIVVYCNLSKAQINELLMNNTAIDFGDRSIAKTSGYSISLDDDGNTLEASEMYITLYIWPKFFSGYKIGLDFYDEANSIWEQVELTPNMEMMNTDALDDAYIDYILQLISEHQDEINELIGIAGKNIDINITQV